MPTRHGVIGTLKTLLFGQHRNRRASKHPGSKRGYDVSKRRRHNVINQPEDEDENDEED